ncbi:hypothetical protein AAT17_02510 [Nonlabens sp. MIC269]|uniref:hypothetical protein n=1 Tax=unclassified Nonlabens TaxID=2615035 RepID=UPI00072190C6|nr:MULTISPECIES: hypothetical protein [unclassified Nonlabens]ALM20199.1 hypothetical protein AAT17_02510 [Nonlabens sp. MIC269]MEE2801573.1 hypothetical protein [Bacteroidota bacterium]PQJ18405.1 hypothetical protein BST93_07900 [Nonlabens tegetincola]
MRAKAPLLILLIAALAFAILNVTKINYADLSWSTNQNPFLGIGLSVAVILLTLIRLRTSTR